MARSTLLAWKWEQGRRMQPSQESMRGGQMPTPEADGYASIPEQ